MPAPDPMTALLDALQLVADRAEARTPLQKLQAIRANVDRERWVFDPQVVEIAEQALVDGDLEVQELALTMLREGGGAVAVRP